jgi:hypothetical protein
MSDRPVYSNCELDLRLNPTRIAAFITPFARGTIDGREHEQSAVAGYEGGVCIPMREAHNG